MEATMTRGYNKAAVLAAALASGKCTRSSIESDTGLSKATVARLVDELIQEGVLRVGSELHREGRGRKSLYLELGVRVGCVVGIDLGSTTTRLSCVDLRGNQLARWKFDTPTGLSRLGLVRRLTAETHQLVDGTPYVGRLAGAVVAVAASVRGHSEIIRPAQAFQHLEGTQFCRTLERHLKAPVILDSDANMALRGEMEDGGAAGISDAALLTVSTGFRAGFARDGQILRGDRSLVGELGSLPMACGEGARRLDDVLSAGGVLTAARAGGAHSANIDEVASAAEDSALGRLREDFIRGLVLAVGAVTLTVDPEIVVFNGRMLPVIERVLPVVRSRLEAALPAVPRLTLTDSDGYSGAHGSAITAAERAGTQLVAAARQQQMTDVG
jgi:predicted NBD/HSP70 family sugar kinase